MRATSDLPSGWASVEWHKLLCGASMGGRQALQLRANAPGRRRWQDRDDWWRQAAQRTRRRWRGGDKVAGGPRRRRGPSLTIDAARRWGAGAAAWRWRRGGFAAAGRRWGPSLTVDAARG